MRQGTGGLFRLIPSSPPPGAGISEKSVRVPGPPDRGRGNHRAHTPRDEPGGNEEFSPPSLCEGGNKSPEPLRKSQICAPPVSKTGGARLVPPFAKRRGRVLA